MAYFKLSLLTSQFENNQSILLQDVISEFNTQENVYNSKQAEGSFTNRKYSYCYSYDEKFSLTQNAQKTLTFSLDKFIIKENLREENPFARNIIIGTQLLLVDQYGNNYFFTVKGIDYDIKETNITYKITCQDTFSYKATRQNSGYTIDNDPAEADFIGAKTVDWWVINRIVPDCHLDYEYLYMRNGLYESTDNSYKIFTYGDDLVDVKRIIKDAYSPETDKDLFETIPFSCSGSNANAALIALGENLGLQLKTFEHISGLKYFWFEPLKNTNRIGGLVYSPYNSIQSFGLGHKGDSLTTIMNVEGPTYDDEIITLIPALTPFFSDYFLETGWDRKNSYRKGMFLAQCQPQHYYWNNDGQYEFLVDENKVFYTAPTFSCAAGATENALTYYNSATGFYYIKLLKEKYDEHENPESLKLNSLFTKVSFNSGDTSKVHLDINNKNANSDTNLWTLALLQWNSSDSIFEEKAVFRDGDDYKAFLNTEYTPWIRIFIGTGIDTRESLSGFQPNLSFSRDISEDDIEFAQAAEECPWLENKLIDFSYFLDSKMITPDEYRTLMNWLTDDLRRVNGQLMFYAKAYYKALHERVKMLADLTAQLDTLGAAANADIVTALRTTGEITEESDISSFSNAYNALLVNSAQEKQDLLNYDDILTDYFNKYFNAEQRFLKNIKRFKDYFNSKPSSWLEPSTAFYKYILSIENQPPEYTRLEYIQSDGAHMIDINFVDTPQTKIEINIQFTSVTPTQQRLFGHGYDPVESPISTWVSFEAYINGNGLWARTTKDEYGDWQATNITADTAQHIFVLDNSKFTIYANGEKVYDGANSGGTITRTNQAKLNLLGRSDSSHDSPSSDWYARAKLYTCKIWDDGILVRDLIPVKYNNTIGLWDLVHDTFYTATGYTAGPEQPLDNYLFYNTKDNSELISIKTNNILKVPYITSGEREGVSYFQIYKNEKPYTVVTAQNYNNYYVRNPSTNADGHAEVKDGELYNDEWSYYDSNNDLISPATIKGLLFNSTDKYRLFDKRSYSFSTAQTAWNNLINLFKNAPVSFIGSEAWQDVLLYNFKFPVSEVYYGYDQEPRCWLVNENNYNDFYKLQLVNTWKKNKRVRYDIFGNRLQADGKDKTYDDLTDTSTYIYCSKENPGKHYSGETPSSVGEITNNNWGITFSFAKNKGGRYIETSYFRTVYSGEYLNNNSTYQIFEIEDWYNTNALTTIFEQHSRGQSMLAYFPLKKMFKNKELIGNHVAELSTKTVDVLLQEEGYSTTNNFIWNKTNTKSFIIVEIMDYYLTPHGSYREDRFYCDQDNQPIDFNTKTLPESYVDTVYHIEDAYLHPSQMKETNDKKFHITGTDYYRQVSEETYELVYTIRQLDDSYEYINPYKITYDRITPYDININAPIYKLKVIRDDTDQSKIIDFKKELVTEYQISFAAEEEHATPLPYYYAGGPSEGIEDPYPTISEGTSPNYTPVWQNKNDFTIGEDTIELKLTKQFKAPIDVSTNGSLWYMCSHGALTEAPFATNISASIEAQLEEYWQQAYTASLYCRYFLPESWQMNYGKDTNLFSNDIIGVDTPSGSNVSYAYLKNIYVPDVSIYEQDGEIVLPKYNLTRGQKVSYVLNDKSIDSDNLIDTSAFKSNIVLTEAIRHLGDNPDEFYAAQAGTTTYYYIKDENRESGHTWSRFMSEKVGSQYSNYSGLYELSYRLIKNNYNPLVLYKYEELKHDKQVIWDTLYQTYGYLMLENNYKNETATTSSELMTLAKYAFKDYSAPERQYNITVIDSTSLKGYKGEEIRVGDGIQIDAQAYYNEYDQIFKSLSQYLFITDISYTLRSPTDISLTVNAIKYQDKLIQRLVKLIK